MNNEMRIKAFLVSASMLFSVCWTGPRTRMAYALESAKRIPEKGDREVAVELLKEYSLLSGVVPAWGSFD